MTLLPDDERSQRLHIVAPNQVRHIKLGAGGAWEQAALADGRLYWGNVTDPLDLAEAGNWDAAREHYRLQSGSPGSATDSVRELKTFYTSDEETLWITFAGGQLWWAFADTQVVRADPANGRPACFRRTIGGWCNTDLAGNALLAERLSSRLTQVGAYRRTICAVGAADYLLRRLKGESEPGIAQLRLDRDALIRSVATLVEGLHWADFELLVDHLFTRGGWRRTSMLGGTMKDSDLLIEQPLTGERASVQVKSRADAAVFDRCLDAFETGAAERFFFVHHSGSVSFTRSERLGRPVHVWSGNEVAKLVVANGLTDWLVDRAL